jgi:hypothetical protein
MDFKKLMTAIEAKVPVKPVTEALCAEQGRDMMQLEYSGCDDYGTLRYQGVAEYFHLQSAGNGIMTYYACIHTIAVTVDNNIVWAYVHPGHDYVRSLPVRCVRDN